MSFDSLLRHTVDIYRFTDGGETSDWAEPIRTPTLLASVAARVQPLTAAEQVAAHEAGPVAYTHRVFMRPTDLTTADYLLFAGERYDVMNIDDAGGSGHHYEVKARRVVPTPALT